MPPIVIALVVAAAVGAGLYAYRRFTQTFGDHVLANAKLDIGVSNATNPDRILQMVGNYGFSEIVDWCAAAVGTWISEAAGTQGIAPPVPGSAGALATSVQFQDATNPLVGWHSPSDLSANPSLMRPGMVAFWTRGDPSSGEGHTGVVATVDGQGGWTSIEGNAGPTGGVCTINTHDLSSSAFIGMGYFTF